MIDDTIAAIATPLGEGALAVIRLSGADALAIAGRCFRPIGASSQSPVSVTHTLHYGNIIDAEDRVVDEVLLAVMRTPRTFTREDTVEITAVWWPASRVANRAGRRGAMLPGVTRRTVFEWPHRSGAG